MHLLNLQCLGIGDGWPSERNHSAFLYQFPTGKILVDCGEPVSRSFYATGMDYNSLDTILLSHLHFDHLGGFFMLVQSLWLKGRRRPLTVHLPADGIAPIRQLLEAACIFDELLPFSLTLEPLRCAAPILSPPARITPFPTTHLKTFRERFARQHPQEYAAFCFLIEIEGLRIGHSADLGSPEDLHPLLEQPLDLLVCELAHLSPEKLFRLLAERKVRRIVFVHLNHKQWQARERLRALAENCLQGVDFVFATDGEEIVI